MSKKKVADIIIDTLVEAGARHCYGIVGDTLNHVTDAIRRNDAMDWIHVRHEEAGAMAAGGEAFITGQLTVCAGTCGPGSLHFINGLFEAHRNRVPVVLIATQVATEEMGMDFPQEVDLERIYRTCSHFCRTVHSAAQARRVTALAAQTAINRQGVAVVIVPGDITRQDVDDTVAFRAHRPAPRLLPSDAEMAELADLLNKADKLAVYCGSGVAGAETELRQLADTLKIPVAHTSRAKDFVEPDNPYNMGMTGIFGVESGYHAVHDADTLLLLGADFAWRQFYPDDATLIQIDADPTHLGRRHPVDLGLAGHVKDTLAALLPRLQARQTRPFLDACLNHRQSTETWLAKEAHAGDDGLIHPQYLTRLLDTHAADDAVFTADGGSPMVWALRHIRANGRRRILPSLVHGTMANAMPSALGIATACPKRQVIALCGDGGLAMLLGDMLTAVQASIPVKLLVYNNDSLGFVEMEQKVEGLLDAFTALINPDFGRVAEAMGMYGRRVTEAHELEAAVQAWLAHPGPALLDVAVNRLELVMPPKIETSQVAHTALYSAKAVMHGRGGEVKALLRSNFLD